MKIRIRGINKEHLYFIEELANDTSDGIPSPGNKIVHDNHSYLVKEVTWFFDKGIVILEVVEL